MARLDHPHIVPLYDYWREPGAAYIVTRLFRGGSLNDAFGHGPLETTVAAEIVDEVGSALALAHRHGVVHGDVKPENILFDEAHRAYLCDFGIAAGDGRADDGPWCTAPEVEAGRRADGDGGRLQLRRRPGLRTDGGLARRSAGGHRRLACGGRLGDRPGDRGRRIGPLPRCREPSKRRCNTPCAPLPSMEEGPSSRTRTRACSRSTRLTRRTSSAEHAKSSGCWPAWARPALAGRFIAVVGPSGSGKSSRRVRRRPSRPPARRAAGLR